MRSGGIRGTSTGGAALAPASPAHASSAQDRQAALPAQRRIGQGVGAAGCAPPPGQKAGVPRRPGAEQRGMAAHAAPRRSRAAPGSGPRRASPHGRRPPAAAPPARRLRRGSAPTVTAAAAAMADDLLRRAVRQVQPVARLRRHAAPRGRAAWRAACARASRGRSAGRPAAQRMLAEEQRQQSGALHAGHVARGPEAQRGRRVGQGEARRAAAAQSAVSARV